MSGQDDDGIPPELAAARFDGAAGAYGYSDNAANTYWEDYVDTGRRVKDPVTGQICAVMEEGHPKHAVTRSASDYEGQLASRKIQLRFKEAPMSKYVPPDTGPREVNTFEDVVHTYDTMTPSEKKKLLERRKANLLNSSRLDLARSQAAARMHANGELSMSCPDAGESQLSKRRTAYEKSKLMSELVVQSARMSAEGLGRSFLSRVDPEVRMGARTSGRTSFQHDLDTQKRNHLRGYNYKLREADNGRSRLITRRRQQVTQHPDHSLRPPPAAVDFAERSTVGKSGTVVSRRQAPRYEEPLPGDIGGGGYSSAVPEDAKVSLNARRTAPTRDLHTKYAFQEETADAHGVGRAAAEHGATLVERGLKSGIAAPSDRGGFELEDPDLEPAAHAVEYEHHRRLATGVPHKVRMEADEQLPEFVKQLQPDGDVSGKAHMRAATRGSRRAVHVDGHAEGVTPAEGPMHHAQVRRAQPGLRRDNKPLIEEELDWRDRAYEEAAQAAAGRAIARLLQRGSRGRLEHEDEPDRGAVEYATNGGVVAGAGARRHTRVAPGGHAAVQSARALREAEDADAQYVQLNAEAEYLAAPRGTARYVGPNNRQVVQADWSGVIPADEDPAHKVTRRLGDSAPARKSVVRENPGWGQEPVSELATVQRSVQGSGGRRGEFKYLEESYVPSVDSTDLQHIARAAATAVARVNHGGARGVQYLEDSLPTGPDTEPLQVAAQFGPAGASRGPRTKEQVAFRERPQAHDYAPALADVAPDMLRARPVTDKGRQRHQAAENADDLERTVRHTTGADSAREPGVRRSAKPNQQLVSEAAHMDTPDEAWKPAYAYEAAVAHDFKASGDTRSGAMEAAQRQKAHARASEAGLQTARRMAQPYRHVTDAGTLSVAKKNTDPRARLLEQDMSQVPRATPSVVTRHDAEVRASTTGIWTPVAMERVDGPTESSVRSAAIEARGENTEALRRNLRPEQMVVAAPAIQAPRPIAGDESPSLVAVPKQARRQVGVLDGGPKLVPQRIFPEAPVAHNKNNGWGREAEQLGLFREKYDSGEDA